MNLFSISFTSIFIERLFLALMFSLCFFNIQSKYSEISNTEHDPSGHSNSSFHVGADILNLLFLHDFFIFSMHSKC